jgi:hypothetical protein
MPSVSIIRTSLPYGDSAHRAPLITHMLCTMHDSHLVLLLDDIDTDMMRLVAQSLPIGTACAYHADCSRVPSLLGAILFGWACLCCFGLYITCADAVPLYLVPPILYPLWVFLVWALAHCALRTRLCRHLVFAIENDVAACGDETRLQSWHMSRARASKRYDGARGVLYSVVSACVSPSAEEFRVVVRSA